MSNAALKMGKPGELCTHTKKLMAFCQTEAKSIKAMKRHIGVVDTFMQNLMSSMLEQKLIWRQSNGMYKTTQNKLHLIEQASSKSAEQSLLALASNETAAQEPEQAEELIEIELPEPHSSALDIAIELDTLANLLQPDQYPVVDDIDAKQRALSGISLIIKPHAPQLVIVLDQLATDLAVISLHQSRNE